MRKLSASGISTFLKSPRAYYWKYVAGIEPVTLSVATFDHDRICGTCWSAFVARFYDGVPEEDNLRQTLAEWNEATDGWVPYKAKERLTGALTTWAAEYYHRFNPKDGCRVQSELKVENDRFIGYLDGWNPETKIVHEVKSTSRCPQISEQLWKVTNSLQVRLYAVLTGAEGVCIEFAYKDAPQAIFRGPVTPVTAEQRERWELQLNALADTISGMGDDPNHYPCHPDGCNITGKNFTAMCGYQVVCEQGLDEVTRIGYKFREQRR